ARQTVAAAPAARAPRHLLPAPLHAHVALRRVQRITAFSPPHQRDPIRVLLAESLLGILSQRLLPPKEGSGRVLALEVLLNTPLIRDYIKDASQTPLIKDALESDNIRGMQTFDQHLAALVLDGDIGEADAEAVATSPHELRLMLTRQQGGLGEEAETSGFSEF